MKNVLIIFGGRSAEHEVSIISARNIVAALDKMKFNPILVVISRTGNWHYLNHKDVPESLAQVSDSMPGAPLCTLIKRSEGTFLMPENNEAIKVDVAFPVLHGPMGEDGTIQGLFEIVMLPYVGPGVLASAVCMDKDICKKILKYKNIPVVPYITLYDQDKAPSFDEVCIELGCKEIFIKPSSMGSSVGIEKAKSQDDYTRYLKKAFEYSSKVVLEKAMKIRELECAVIGNSEPVATSIAEIKPTHEFYSYDAKYLDPEGASLTVPAKNVPEDIEAKIKNLAVEVFKATECKGMARIDFFLDENNEIYVNEPNTIPGFTSISMYPQMVMSTGISYGELVSKLIELALDEYGAKSSISLVPDID